MRVEHPEDSKKIETIIEAFDYERTLRAKSDPLRFEAMSLLGHRTKSLSACDDSPVEDKRLYEGEDAKAIETLESGFNSALMSQNSKWFACNIVPRIYRMGQSPIEDLEYTSYVEKAMMDEFATSNMYASSKLASKDAIIGGYSCQLVQEDETRHRTFYDTLVPWRCWFNHDRYYNWDTFFYTYTLNGYEMLERFPNLSDTLRKQCIQGRSSARYRMLFAIVDRKKMFGSDGQPVSFLVGKNMKYAALQIAMDTQEIVEESGYNDFPVVIHTWEQISDSHYGVGIPMKYIAEFRRLHSIAYEAGVAFAKINHKAWNVPEGIKETFSDEPYARNYFTSQNDIPQPMDKDPDIKSIQEYYMNQVDIIRRICYNDYMNFLTTHDSVYTATQVNQIKSESLAQIAPLSDNVLNQKLLPILKLTYVNMLNNGRITRPDHGVMADFDQNGEPKNAVRFSFVSAMSDQLMMYTQSNAAQYIADLGAAYVNITQDPTLMSKNFKVSNILKVAAKAAGADADFIMTDEETKKIEEEQAKAAQQQQQMALLQQASEIDRNEAGASNLNNAQGMR